MAVSLHRVFKAVQKVISQYEQRRVKEGLSVRYQHTKDGMLDVHTEWTGELRTLYELIKKKAVPAKPAVQAIRMAASAIKFAADLGEGWAIDKYVDNESVRYCDPDE